eukprot:1139933-Pelagomonas_calceolata.AAC.2
MGAPSMCAMRIKCMYTMEHQVHVCYVHQVHVCHVHQVGMTCSESLACTRELINQLPMGQLSGRAGAAACSHQASAAAAKHYTLHELC